MKETKKLQKRRETKNTVTLYTETVSASAGKSHCSTRRC